MRIVSIGGGPAGLYAAILLKRAQPAHEITVLERNQPGDTFGWGVVFSDKTLDNLAEGDPESHARIVDNFAHWDDIDIHFKGRTLTSGGHGFCGISRRKLLNILQERAEALGVVCRYGVEVDAEAAQDIIQGADLVLAADGINSPVRSAYAGHFQPDIEMRRNKFIWLGTHRVFKAFTFIFVETEWGWFQAHAYQFDAETATFIVETTNETWQAAGLADLDTDASLRFCETLFAPWLDGHALMANSRHLRGSAWINFPRVTNAHWVKDNLVLIGDAAHSAHFSIGSGTKLALEDALALARHVSRGGSLAEALAAYEAERRIEVLKIQSAARNSTEWFEAVDRYSALEAEQFAYSLLTRSQRVSHENLRLRDRAWLEGMERWLARRAGIASGPRRAPMFLPFRLRDLTLANRVVVSPMATYKAEEGVPGPFHLVHLGARALGGAGLIITEMTCVSAEGRITPGCCGLWNETQGAAWRQIVDFVHRESGAAICLQIGHAGPKGSTKRGWDGMDQPLDAGNWPLIAASPVAWSADNQIPRAMDEADMDRVRADFVATTRLAIVAGFDMIELHAAHGYLLSAFISPLTNRRTDGYGGSLSGRLRFPLSVFAAMRAVWPPEKPMSVRISATDWVEGGVTPAEAVEIAKAFQALGCDLIDVSAGQTSIAAKPVYGRMFQTPFADRIRQETGMATLAVGNITEADQINAIIAAGRADLCALARPHLTNPHFTLHAAIEHGYGDQVWPKPYESGKAQMMRLKQRGDSEPEIVT